MGTTNNLQDRLQKIWQKPNYPDLFQKISKRDPHRLRKNSIIFNDGDPLDRLYCISEGFVKLFRLSDEGKETTIYLYGPGDVLGIRALTSQDECAKHTAEALTDLKILTVSRKEYLDALTQEPSYLLDLLHLFINRLNYTEKKLEAFIVTDTKARIAIFLDDCVTRFCPNTLGPSTLPLPLTHQRIAEFVGSFRETVTLALQKLEKERILSSNKSIITILKPELLHTIAISNITQTL